MSNERRKPVLDLQACYSGFKVEELEYIGYNRTSEDHSDDFLDTLDAGPLDHGATSSDEDDEMLGQNEFETRSLCAEHVRSYLCSTPTRGGKHRGLFRQDSDLSGFNDLESDSVRNFPSKLDSGFQTQNVSAANSVISYFGDENGFGSGSLESLPGSSRNVRNVPFNANTSMRKRIELDSDLHDPYNEDDLELSIEEEISHMSQTSTFGTLKRRLSLKVMRRKVSTGLFGSYLQRTSLPPAQSQQSIASAGDDQAYLFNNSKPTGHSQGPMNFWFKKFRNRHFI